MTPSIGTRLQEAQPGRGRLARASEAPSDSTQVFQIADDIDDSCKTVGFSKHFTAGLLCAGTSWENVLIGVLLLNKCSLFAGACLGFLCAAAQHQQQGRDGGSRRQGAACKGRYGPSSFAGQHSCLSLGTERGEAHCMHPIVAFIVPSHDTVSEIMLSVLQHCTNNMLVCRRYQR